MRRTLARILVSAACWAVIQSAPAHAQETPAAAPDSKLQPLETPEQAQDQAAQTVDQADVDTLRTRMRSTMHPGDPLRLVGNDEEGNDLRASTPALARGTHDPALVDSEANYQRALAMYGDGTHFHTPLPRAPGSEPDPITPRPKTRRNAPIVEEAPADRGPAAAPWSVLSGLLVSGLLLAWFFVRVRPALMAPKDELLPAPAPFVWNPTRRVTQPLAIPEEEPQAPLPRGAAIRNGSARVAARPKPR